MQLRISLAAATLLASMAAQAEDYVSLQYLQYNESENRTAVSAPSLMLNKDFGTDYTLNVNVVADAVSGASENYYDAASGASAFSRGIGVNATDVTYGNVEYEDTRVAGGASLITRFDNRDELTVGFNYSSESDFYSAEGSLEYMHWLTSSKNNSLSLGVSYQSNEILVECDPDSATSSCDAGSGASEAMTNDAINVQASFFQNINSESYLKASLFYVGDSGYLSNPYSNVVRNYDGINADVVAENRPDSRTGYGASFKYANAITSNLSAQIGYRYYTDDWDIDSHTIDTDFYYEPSSNWLIKIGLRYYMQSEANFYSGQKDYFTNEEFASSDVRLSDFDAITYKTDVEYKVTEDFSVNFGANYYDQSSGIDATYLITGVTYKF